MKYLLIILLLFTLASCGGVKDATTTNEIVKDSTSITTREIKRDTLIQIPGDTTRVKIPVFELDEQIQHYQSPTKRSQLYIRKVNDTIDVECLCKKYKREIALMDKIIERQRQIIKNKSTVTTKPVKYTPWYMKALAFIGGGMLVYFLGKIAISTFKPKLL